MFLEQSKLQNKVGTYRDGFSKEVPKNERRRNTEKKQNVNTNTNTMWYVKEAFSRQLLAIGKCNLMEI